MYAREAPCLFMIRDTERLAVQHLVKGAQKSPLVVVGSVLQGLALDTEGIQRGQGSEDASEVSAFDGR